VVKLLLAVPRVNLTVSRRVFCCSFRHLECHPTICQRHSRGC